MRSLIKNGRKSLIIRSWHLDIDIIIPRYKPFMSNSTNQRSIGKKISNIIFITKRSNFKQYVQRSLFMFVY